MRTGIPILAAMLLAGCGYHTGGHADAIPKTVKTIAIPAFGNITTSYKLAQRLPADITREFITRTHYRVVADPREADAVLTGAVVNLFSHPTVSGNGRSTGVEAVVKLQMTLTHRETGKVLFTWPGIEFRERYEISVDPNAYFDESTAALERLSKDVARSAVSAILEQF
jgi:outer membrane lipopolysaccharide assembly protein LptE/RlpB